MEAITLFDSELKIMKIIWENERITAKEISIIAGESIGWNKNTTYTILKKLIKKGAISRGEPNFICKPLVTKQQVQLDETKKLVHKLYDGSSRLFLSSFIEEEQLSETDLKALKDLIEKKM